jgi:DNA-binding NarL/FixJ family response regulator/anti-sigma regulatory factor (Ser/Thr protein kinase)
VIRVLLADDQALVRAGFRALLDAQEDLEVVGEAGDGEDAVRLARELAPDVVLMDVRMPVMDGIEATRRMKAARPELGVVALTAQEDDRIVREMLVAGATGYVLKDSDGDVILNAISEAAGGGAVLSPAVAPRVIDQLTEALERERYRARELEEAHVALVERVSRRHELVARLGHELRTPVTVILGVARTLAGGGLDDRQRNELLERLVGRATALSRLVERFETALDTGSEDRIDVAATARELAASRPRVRVTSEPGLPPVLANRVLVQRILEELVDNACKFSDPEAQVEVSVTLGAGALQVRVSDAGEGIRPEDQDRVFEPLEQAEALDARIHQGAGVGLSLGRAAARAMDGDLVLERSGPDGSTFLWTVALPPVR